MAILCPDALARYNAKPLPGYRGYEWDQRRWLAAWLCGIADMVARSRYDDDIAIDQLNDVIKSLGSLEEKAKDHAKERNHCRAS